MQVENGETVLIERDGRPIVRMTSVSGGNLGPKRSRAEGFGILAGCFQGGEDIKTPFAEEIEEMFYGKPDEFTQE